MGWETLTMLSSSEWHHRDNLFLEVLRQCSKEECWPPFREESRPDPVVALLGTPTLLLVPQLESDLRRVNI